MNKGSLTLISTLGHEKGKAYKKKLTIRKEYVVTVIQDTDSLCVEISYIPKGYPQTLGIILTFKDEKNLEEGFDLINTALFYGSDPLASVSTFKSAFDLSIS